MAVPAFIWIVLGGFVAVGFFFLLRGWRFGRLGAKMPDNWLPAQGVIVRYHWQDLARNGVLDRVAFPVVQYTGPDGRQYEFTSNVTIDTGVYRTGKQVGILVDPRAPSNARLANATRIATAGGCLMGGLGLVLAGIGLAGIAILIFLSTR